MSFTQLLDKGTTTDVHLAVWCPSMDLLALVATDGQLSVHRLNWQRLWSITPDSPVSALCWRPDGKLLAAALEVGTVSGQWHKSPNLTQAEYACADASFQALHPGWRHLLAGCGEWTDSFEAQGVRGISSSHELG